MKTFKYIIYDNKTGKRKEGKLNSDAEDLAVKQLQEGGNTLIHISEQTALSFEVINKIEIGGISLKQKVIFVRQFAIMISSGLPLIQSIQLLESQNKGKMREVLQNVIKDIEGGKSLADSFALQKGIFSRVQVSLIKAGENSGKFPEVLNRMAEDIEKSAALRSKVLGAFIYPAIILSAVVGVVIVLLLTLIPQMESLYSSFGNAQLPFATESLVIASNFLQSYWWIVATVVGVFVFGFRYYKSTPKGKIFFDHLILKIPLFGNLIAKTNVTNFARTLSMFTGAGIPILDSLDMIAESLTNEIFAEGIRDASKKVEKGIPLSVPLGTNPVFPPILSRMIAIGESTGSVDVVLNKLAQYFDAEIDTVSSNLTKLMEPITLLLMAVVIGYIAVAVYLPIYGLANVIH